MRIGLTGIFVDDQDRAERFYTQVLGFHVKVNAPYCDTERWLSVVSPEEPDGVQLVLHLTDEPARAFRAAGREQGRPAISLTTDDCAADAARLRAKGVVFVKEPGRMAYGGHGRGVRRHLRQPYQPPPGLTPERAATVHIRACQEHRWARS